MAYTVKGKGKFVARKRRHLRLRKKVQGTPSRPRLVVTRSNRHMVAQVVDDTIGHTLVSASTKEAALSLQSAQRPQASPLWSSTAVAISTTAALRQSQKPPVRADLSCD